MKKIHSYLTAMFAVLSLTWACSPPLDGELDPAPPPGVSEASSSGGEVEPTRDAGSPVVAAPDAGPLVAQDAGEPAAAVDAGTTAPIPDAGAPAPIPDAGAPAPDPIDAGSPAPDPIDAGSPAPVSDAGVPAPVIDAGAPAPVPDAGSPPPVTTPSAEWLSTQGNRILLPNGARWHGRGANLHDTRSCSACAGNPSSVAEVNRRMDLLVDDWKANFIRLDLESYEATAGQVNWASVMEDPSYLNDLRQIVAHAMTKPGLYVMLSLWIDPSINSQGWPTNSTAATWRVLAAAFKDESRVLFGLVNEPQSNFNGAQDSQVWAAMNSSVQAIRDVEGTGPRHLVAVQGTRGWSRVLDYYLTHPITAGGGVNVIYETHVYDPPSEFPGLFERASQTLPVIIGEFGPANGYMTEADCTQLMTRARAAEVPHLAWTFHQRCPPNLIQETAPGCGINMPLRPTAWGTVFKNALAVPW